MNTKEMPIRRKRFNRSVITLIGLALSATNTHAKAGEVDAYDAPGNPSIGIANGAPRGDKIIEPDTGIASKDPRTSSSPAISGSEPSAYFAGPKVEAKLCHDGIVTTDKGEKVLTDSLTVYKDNFPNQQRIVYTFSNDSHAVVVSTDMDRDLKKTRTTAINRDGLITTFPNGPAPEAASTALSGKITGFVKMTCDQVTYSVPEILFAQPVVTAGK